MTKPKTPPPPVNAAPATQPQTTANKITLGKLTPKKRPPRMVLMAEPGWGKSTAAAYAGGAILQADGETGYETLLGEGLVPSIDAATVSDWRELLNLLDQMLFGDIDYPYIAFDALAGFQQLCDSYICGKNFDSDYDKFMAYGRGPAVAAKEWQQLLTRLEFIHRRNVGVIILSHSLVKKYKNPLGDDFDKYISDAHEKIWMPTEKWADTVLFGKFLTVAATDESKRTRGIGGTERVIYCNQSDAYNAKNRYAMPDRIDVPHDPAQVWATIDGAINANANAGGK